MITITVRGEPGPQGSKNGFLNKRTGKVQMVESSKKVGPWRDAVRAQAQMAMGALGIPPLEGPLLLVVDFYLKRPVSAPRRIEWPAKYPDLSKLVRATEDGLTDGGIWRDDAQVVKTISCKMFATEAWPMGARIGVVPITDRALEAATPYIGEGTA